MIRDGFERLKNTVKKYRRAEKVFLRKALASRLAEPWKSYWLGRALGCRLAARDIEEALY